MDTETTTTTTEDAPEVGSNISLAQLGAMLSKKGSSQPGKATATTEPGSEQTELDGEQNTQDSELQTEAEAEVTENEGEQGTQEEGELGEKPAKVSQEVWDAIKAAQIQKGGAKLVSRIHEVVDQRDAERNARLDAERRLSDLEAKINGHQNQEQQQAPATGIPGKELFEGDESVQQLDQKLAQVEEVLRWARKNPNGGTITTKDGETEYSEEQVQQYQDWADRERVRLAAERSTTVAQLRNSFISQRQTNLAKAVKLYPWLEQKTSPEFQQAIKVIRENPGVVNTPDMELRVARYVEGLKREEALGKKPATQPLRRGTPTPVVTHSPNAAPRANGNKPQQAAVEQFEKSGRVDDLGKLLAESRRSRNREVATK